MTAGVRSEPRGVDAAIAVAILVFTVVVFWGVGDYEFLGYDDNLYVTENAMVARGLTAEGLTWAFTTGHAGNWVPLTWLSHMLDAEMFEDRAAGHHRTTVILHALNALLLFVVFVRMTGDRWPSAFVALAFAVHPLHVESVAWIADRKDVLSALFCLLAIAAYVSYTAKPSRWRYLGVLGLFVPALMAKQTAVTLPFVLLLLDLWPLGRLELGRAALKRRVREKIPMAVVAIAAIVVAYAVQLSAGAVQSADRFPLAGRVANAVASYGWYVVKTAWPTGLAVPYPYVAPLAVWQVVGSAVALVAVTVLAIRAVRARPYVTVGWLWFVGTLLPVIGLVQIGTHARADRYTYLAIVGLFILLAWGVPSVSRAPWWRPLTGAAGVAILIAWTAVTLQTLPHWRNTETLSRRALTVTTDNKVAHFNLAVHLGRTGRTDEAIEHYRATLRIRPHDYKAHWNLGNALFREGRATEAVPHYREVLRIDPDAVEPMAKLAAILAATGGPGSPDRDEAVRLAERAATLSERQEPHVLWVLANAYEAAGRLRQAESSACAAWRLAVARQERALRAEIERRFGDAPCRP